MKKYLKLIAVAFAIAILIAGIGWSIYLAFGDKLFEYSNAKCWIDVCKPKQ
jgi:hypothetical protein